MLHAIGHQIVPHDGRPHTKPYPVRLFLTLDSTDGGMQHHALEIGQEQKVAPSADMQHRHVGTVRPQAAHDLPQVFYAVVCDKTVCIRFDAERVMRK